MIKLIVVIKRTAAMSHTQFHEYWRTRHALKVRSIPACAKYIRRYIQAHTLDSEYAAGDPAYDGTAEIWFDSVQDKDAFFSDPDYLASVVFNRALYGGSPYGWPEEGTPETTQKLDSAQLVKFHNASYAPNQSLLAFAGDIRPDEAFSAAEKYFGSWTKIDVPAAVPPAPEAFTGMHIWLIDKPDAVQTQIRVGKLGIRPDLMHSAITPR